MESVTYNELTLAYQVFGSGQTVVVALHGHSKSPADFETFVLPNIRIIAPSLFHHGHSIFPQERINKSPLKADEFYALMQLILAKEHVDQFHLIAYSQGGRFALKLAEKWIDQLQSFTLLSPDGIDQNGFYQRASTRKINWALMSHFERYPNHFYTTMKWIKKLGLVNEKVVDLSSELSKSKWHMACASQSWRNFRKINTNPRIIGKLIADQQLNFKIFMGKYDGIFPPKMAYNFVREAGLPDNSVKVIDCGHDFFKKEAIQLYKNQLPFLNNGYIYSHEKADATHS